MAIRLACFPGGKQKAVTLSYDDGREHDRRLVEIMNRYGLKGTFHLNSGNLGKEHYIAAEEVPALFSCHEVSAHTVTHPFLELAPPEDVVNEIMQDRAALERLAGYQVRGMSYPFGTYNDRVVSLLPSLGIEYARTVESTGAFDLPANFLTWHPTCHHKDMLDAGRRFLDLDLRFPRMALLYVWGHSYEFADQGNWDELERFGELISGHEEIWYATNAEIASYMQAVQRLRFSADCRLVHNPSAVPVWVQVDGEAQVVEPGAIVRWN